LNYRYQCVFYSALPVLWAFVIKRYDRYFYSTGKTLRVAFSSSVEIRFSRADSAETRFSRAEILRKQTARATNNASKMIKK
jgi:hypothetical protein